MFYVALTFWMMLGLLEAYGIFKLWEGIVRPRWINAVLLPGTVVAETAHFLAALLTGSSVREAKLVSDEPVGQGGEPAGAKGIPVLSPLMLGLLPILAGLTVICLLYHNFNFDKGIVALMRPESGSMVKELTWRLDGLNGWFKVAENVLELTRHLIDALVKQADNWKSWLFVYLTACLAIRMVPLRGNLRGGMGAILLVGSLAAGLGALSPRIRESLDDTWPLLAYVIALLTLLLLVALLVRGVVAMIFVLADKPQPKRPG